MRRPSLLQQIEVDKQSLCRRVGFEREGSFPARSFKKPFDTFAGQLMKGSFIARRCVERRDTERPFPVKILDKARIDFSRQGAHVSHATPNEFATGLVDQRFHFGRPAFLIGTPHVNESGLSQLTCIVVLSLGGRDSILVLIAVFVTKDSQIDVTALYFFQVDLVAASVFSGKFFKKENF